MKYYFADKFRLTRTGVICVFPSLCDTIHNYTNRFSFKLNLSSSVMIVNRSILISERYLCYQFLNNKPIKCRFRIYSYRTFSINKVYNKEKITMELSPEVENLLKSAEVKHRKHPGIRKINPVTLPEILKSSVDKVISGFSEKLLIKEARNLCHNLSHRRLPVEEYEIGKKAASFTPLFDGNFENLYRDLNKEKREELKKRICLEIGRWKPIEYNRHTCLVYLVGRLAPNYASVSHLFDELKKIEPTFKPKTYFDFGTGVGSSLWAAHSHWSDTIKEYCCVDTSPDMITVCEDLITNQIAEEKYISPVYFRQFLPSSESVKYDLVVSAFSLLDLPNANERLKVIETLWRKTKEYLVIVEYGTVAGFYCVLDARDFILHVENDPSPEFSIYSSGAHVVSPCPHDFACPKFAERSSCGFTVPYYSQFPRFSHTIEKDWISYVILRKGPRPEDSKTFPRIVKPLLKKNKHIFCRLCCSDGNLNEIIVTRGKHGRHAYRCVRESSQGDILPVHIKTVETVSDTK